jgi:Na+-transporting NADH:ubiquinone oxidoreductase subunit A
MKTVKIKKGWQFKIAGQPSSRLTHCPAGRHIAFVADKLSFIKPRLLVKKGDHVLIGSVLFEDKKHPDFKFLSPGCGTIADITYGPRRVIHEIIITIEDSETHESFNVFSDARLEQTDRKTLISELMTGGMWPLIHQLPFRQIADPGSMPNAVWVCLGSADPFLPSADVYLNGQEDFFEFGLKALCRIADTINISGYAGQGNQKSSASNLVTHRIVGKYPASDPGVILYHTKKTAAENQDWYIDGQDVIHIGKFLKTGIYPIDRIVAFSDGTEQNSRHIKTRTGICLKNLASSDLNDKSKRWIVGGVLSGYTSSGDSFLDLYQTSVKLIDETVESELFGFVRPGFKKLSNSRTVISALSSKPLAVNNDMHGEERPCINCGYCASICPVDIMPQYTYKSLYADEIEEALAHGLLDCVECGLCSFVCPSKIDLSDYLIDARHRYYKELSQSV